MRLITAKDTTTFMSAAKTCKTLQGIEPHPSEPGVPLPVSFAYFRLHEGKAKPALARA